MNLSKFLTLALVLSLATLASSQTPTTPPSAFSATTISFGLSPLTLPGTDQTLTGMETDAMIHFTPNNIFGSTTLISTEPFIGGRYDRVFPSIANFLENHTALTGGHYEAYATVSFGVVKADRSHYGERAGIGLRYAPNGSDNFDVGVEIQWNNLPGIAHNKPSVVVGPHFRF